MDVPVTIITGYLGAGKTTLLKMIAEGTPKRIAILMNEFGEIAVDSRIVEGRNIMMSELSGGCVCCSLAGEFEAAMKEILEAVKPEWIVVETTGVAEPAALAGDVLEGIAGVALDSIVTVVDCDSILRFPSLGHTGREQIALADIIVMNKIDLLNDSEIEGVRARIVSMNGRALLIDAVKCEFDTGVLFGINRKEPVKAHSPHRIEFDYFDFVSDARFDYDKVVAFVGSLPKEIYRCKGFFSTSGRGYLLNYVAGRYTISEFDCYRTELVFIGKGIAKMQEEVRESLGRCII